MTAVVDNRQELNVLFALSGELDICTGTNLNAMVLAMYFHQCIVAAVATGERGSARRRMVKLGRCQSNF